MNRNIELKKLRWIQHREKKDEKSKVEVKLERTEEKFYYCVLIRALQEKSRENGRALVFEKLMGEHVLELKKLMSPQIQEALHIYQAR